MRERERERERDVYICTHVIKNFFYFIYFIVNESWPYPPPQYGNIPSGRMAHSSVYVPETGLLYIYGGEHLRDTLSSIIAYDPVTNYWSRVISEGTLRQSFHRTLLMNGALVSFGGYTTSDDCFSSELVIYDICKSLYIHVHILYKYIYIYCISYVQVHVHVCGFIFNFFQCKMSGGLCHYPVSRATPVAIVTQQSPLTTLPSWCMEDSKGPPFTMC